MKLKELVNFFKLISAVDQAAHFSNNNDNVAPSYIFYNCSRCSFNESSFGNSNATFTCKNSSKIREGLSSWFTKTKLGTVPIDNSILKSISTVCSRLPAVQSTEFADTFNSDFNDAMLLSTLATVTKSVENMNALVDKRIVVTAWVNPPNGSSHVKKTGSQRSEYPDRMMY
jgi:hypothetical protein